MWNEKKKKNEIVRSGNEKVCVVKFVEEIKKIL